MESMIREEEAVRNTTNTDLDTVAEALVHEVLNELPQRRNAPAVVQELMIAEEQTRQLVSVITGNVRVAVVAEIETDVLEEILTKAEAAPHLVEVVADVAVWMVVGMHQVVEQEEDEISGTLLVVEMNVVAEIPEAEARMQTGIGEMKSEMEIGVIGDLQERARMVLVVVV